MARTEKYAATGARAHNYDRASRELRSSMLIMAHLGHQKTALESHVFIWEQAFTGALKGGEHPHGGEFKLLRLWLEFPGAFKANGSDLRDSVDVYE